MRDFLVNLAAGLVTALLLYGVSLIMPMMRSSSGPYLDVDVRAEAVGSASVITITAHNAAQVGIKPLRACLRARGDLLAALVRSLEENGAIPVEADSVQWTGELGAGESLTLILVLGGGSLIGDSARWFTGTYRMVDARGFATDTPAIIRPASDARLQSITAAAKIAGGIAVLGLLIGGGMYMYRRRRRSKVPASSGQKP